MPAQTAMSVVIAPGPISLGTALAVTADGSAKASATQSQPEQCHRDESTWKRVGWNG